MRILGAAPASDYVALALIEVNEARQWSLIDTGATRKITLTDHEESSALRDFTIAIGAFIHSYGVDRMMIRRATYKGQKRSGAVAVKIEVLLQILDCQTQLVPAQSIAKRFSLLGIPRPPALTVYQSDAFATALYSIEAP